MQATNTRSRLDEIHREARIISEQIALLNNHQLIRVYSSLPTLLFFMLLKGVAFGLGSVIGATIVVSILAYVLSQFEFLPIVGEWVRALLDIIQQQ